MQSLNTYLYREELFFQLNVISKLVYHTLYYLYVYIICPGSGGWTAAAGPGFLYTFSVTAGPLTVPVPYSNSRAASLISEDTIQDRYIDLSGTNTTPL